MLAVISGITVILQQCLTQCLVYKKNPQKTLVDRKCGTDGGYDRGTQTMHKLW